MFDRLTGNEVSDICSSLDRPVQFSKGEELYRNGVIAFLVNGKATIKRLNDMGDSITIRSISCGEIFGAASVFGNSNFVTSSITADTVCEVIYISQEKFCDIIKQYPQMSVNYIKYLSDRIRFLNRKLDAFTAKLTEEKLYEFLLSQSDSEGNVNLNFGIAELARRLKVGRTSIYRDISALESKGLLNRCGHSFKILK